MYGNNRRKGAHTPLANIVRQETRDGRLIVRFLVDAMQGKLDGAKPHHRLDAARQLLAVGFDGAQAFIDHNTPDVQPRAAAASSRTANADNRRLDPKLAKLIRQETDNGRTAVRFLVDVMQGALPDFKPHHRLAAARELLHRGFDNAHAEDPDDYYHDRRPSRRPKRTAKTTPGDRKDDTQNGRISLAERDLVEKHYGSEDMRRKAIENTVYGKIELEDRRTFEDLTDHRVEALVHQYGSPKAWFAAVEKFARAEATLEQLLSGSIDLDDTGDTANANAGSDERDRRAVPHAGDGYEPQEEPPPEEPPPKPPNEPSEWDLRAANKVLDSTTLMGYYR